MNTYSESEIREMLNNHVCKVIFTKNKNNVDRTMICTSNWKWLKRPDVSDAIGFVPPSGKIKKEWKEGLICVFDIDMEDWRSFYCDKIKSISIFQNLSTEDIEDDI